MVRLILFRVLSLVAIAFCMAIVVDELLPVPAFCSFRAGCEDVVHSAYGRPLGIPLSLLGLIAFGTFFVLTLFPRSRPAKFIGAMAVLAGIVGLALVALQIFVLKRTCPLCLIVDTSAILLAAVELGWPASTNPTTHAHPLPWSITALIVVALPPLWLVIKPPPVIPAQVQAVWNAGQINVVEITDFACPHCQQTHAVLERFLRQHRERVHFVRMVAPLKHHEHSRPAAKLYLIAHRHGKAATAADRLFATTDHSPQSLRQLAEQIGLDTAEFEAAMNDQKIDAELDETLRWVEANHHGGLPQIWMNNILMIGQQTDKSLSAALRRAERTNHNAARR